MKVYSLTNLETDTYVTTSNALPAPKSQMRHEFFSRGVAMSALPVEYQKRLLRGGKISLQEMGKIKQEVKAYPSIKGVKSGYVAKDFKF